jgi:hypothetical protein
MGVDGGFLSRIPGSESLVYAMHVPQTALKERVPKPFPGAPPSTKATQDN